MINEPNLPVIDEAIRFAYRKKAGSAGLEEQIGAFVRNASRETAFFPVDIERIAKPLNYRVSHEGTKCYINSQYDTGREMEHLFQNVRPETEILILFGIGAGYALEYAGTHLPQLERVVVIEPCLQILVKALSEKEVIQRLQKVPSVTFIWNKPKEVMASNLNAELNNSLNRKISFASHLSYQSLFRDYHDGVNELVLQHIRSTLVNLATVQSNIFLKTQNIIHNLKYKAINIRYIAERIQGRPAIMVSAGPSLDKNVHLLAEAQDKAFIIAVGTAVKTLYNKGIKPHARAAFSPYPDENVVFSGIEDYEGIPLIFSNTLDYLVVKNYDAPKARMVMYGDPMTQFFYTKADFAHSLVGGGSTIANVTFDMLCRSGCSKLIVIGQDMAYTGKRLYSEDAWGNVDVSGQEQNLIMTKDVYGEDIYTNKSLYGLKFQFEAMVQQFSGVDIINATEGGLPIDGTRHITLKEALEELTDEYDVAGMLAEAFAEGEKQEASDQEILVQTIKTALEELNQILNINNERFMELQRIRSEAENVKQTLQALIVLEKRELDLLAIDFYRMAIHTELQSPYFAIRSAYQYSGTDTRKKVESLEKTIMGMTMKLSEFGQFLKEQMEEQLLK